MKKTILALRKVNDEALVPFLDPQVNIATVRLTFLTKDGRSTVESIPYFFISGWPANDKKAPLPEFSKKLAEGKLGECLKNYQEYGIRFLTLSYKKETETQLRSRQFEPFRKELKEVFEKEFQSEKVIGEDRLKAHINILDSDSASLFRSLYFHSEQGIWHAIKEEITKFKPKSSRDVRSFFQAPTPSPSLEKVIVDICTLYDMCWCCGDTFASCCHTNTLEVSIVIRTSGIFSYSDQPFKSKPLREERQKFVSYSTGVAYELVPTYKPLIAHTATDDLT